MSLPVVHLNNFFQDFYAMKGNCAYFWGAKPDPNASPMRVYQSDCSGWIRYALVRRGFPNEFPESSESQRDWFLSQGLHQPKYKDILTFAAHDSGRLFVAGFALGGTHRHIYTVVAGTTMECGSSIHGVGSRPAHDFLGQTQWCVELEVSLE